jgi:hypothetical protein
MAEKKDKKEETAFNVLTWNFNRDNIEHYDVLPHFRRRYKERSKDMDDVAKKAWWKNATDAEKTRFMKYYKVPETLDDFKEFVKDESQYQFWARCEYEMICHGWPVKNRDYKLDVHEQIMMNLDIVARILFEELGKKG